MNDAAIGIISEGYGYGATWSLEERLNIAIRIASDGPLLVINEIMAL